MDARTYLKQVADLQHGVYTLRERLETMYGRLDLLKTSMGDGMPRGSSDGKPLENAYAEYAEKRDEYARELNRLSFLETQAYNMLDRARAVLRDGDVHAIGTRHIDILELHYFKGIDYADIAERWGYSESTVKTYAKNARSWLDENRDSDGYPLVPIVSE